MITEQGRNSTQRFEFWAVSDRWIIPLRQRGYRLFPLVVGLPEQLAGHDDALDLVGALVDLGDRGQGCSFRS